jgi:hypothetical protein
MRIAVVMSAAAPGAFHTGRYDGDQNAIAASSASRLARRRRNPVLAPVARPIRLILRPLRRRLRRRFGGLTIIDPFETPT